MWNLLMTQVIVINILASSSRIFQYFYVQYFRGILSSLIDISMGKKSPSPATQATQQRRLSIKMKPKLKVELLPGDTLSHSLQVKSPDVPPSKSRRVPLLKQLTSTLTKAPSPLTSRTPRVGFYLQNSFLISYLFDFFCSKNNTIQSPSLLTPEPPTANFFLRNSE